MGKRRLSREAKERRSKIIGLFVLVIILAGASFYIFGISDKSAVETAVVKEHISKIRKKLGEESGVTIVTQRGIGYRIEQKDLI